MNAHEIDEIIDCLPKDKTILHYFKDRYALELLANHVSTPQTIRSVKQSRYSGLLNKSDVQQAVASCDDGMISAERLRSVWPVDPKAFVLSLGRWGERSRMSYTQTSRTGFNLVLHLNFSNEHDASYKKLINKSSKSPFTYSGHPNDKKGRNTMGWARMDIDLNRGEALIEEIQNDWLREARCDHKRPLSCIEQYNSWKHIKKRWPFYIDAYQHIESSQELLTYLEKCVRPYERIWDEAMLYAAVWFLSEELGIRRIFYNTWETGCRMKGIDMESAPPRSIYTTLPQRFCFDQTEDHPQNIDYRVARAKKKYSGPMNWYLLQL